MFETYRKGFVDLLRERVSSRSSANPEVRQNTDTEIVRAIEHYTNSLQRGLRQANIQC